MIAGWWRPVLVGLTSTLHFACGAPPQWQDHSTWRPEAIERTLITRLVPVADVTVHNAERWRNRSLSDQPWLMVGSNGAGDVWFTYLTFDLSSVTPLPTPTTATLRLTANSSLVLPQDGQSMDVQVWRVHDEWDETAITWQHQPRVLATSSATFSVPPGSMAEAVDLTGLVAECLQQGCTRLSVLLAPANPARDFRVRWHSREAPVEGDPAVASETSVDFQPLGGPSQWVLQNDALQLSLELITSPGAGTEVP